MAVLPTVFVIDDDPEVLSSICWLIGRARLPVRAFTCGADFLKNCRPEEPGCLLLDLRMPKRDGLAVLEDLRTKKFTLPVIMVTGNADISSCVRAFKIGIFDFLEKPLDEARLLDCVRKALAEDLRRREQVHSPNLGERLSQLTPRERQVFDLLVAGKTLKQIASACNITVQSAWRHRRRVFAKCKVHSEVELVRLMLASDYPFYPF
jgi:FixJ family two-component response regulator